MIDKRKIDFISQKLKIPQRDLIEKDLILTKILSILVGEKDFFENYAFKGGTCLTKIHFGYFRFSEDLDFTYLNQNILKNKTKKEMRRIISKEVNKIATLLEKISKEMNLDFKANKNNNKYFEFGGGNRYTTFKIWFNSVESNQNSFIKIQINYKENILFKIHEPTCYGIFSEKIKKEFLFNFPETVPSFKIKSYDLKEILCEKVRAILTRRGVKARDFIDIFIIEDEKNLKVETFKEEIIKKVQDALESKKYLRNLEDKNKSFPKYSLGEEERLLLTEIDKDKYTIFLKRFYKFLDKLMQTILLKQ